jgi:hypothetical protein
MDFIYFQVQKIRKHRGNTTEAYGPSFEVAKTKVRGKSALSGDGCDGPVKDINKTFRIFLVSITTHRGFINGDFLTACRHQIFKFLFYKGKDRFGDRITILIFFIRQKSST